MATVDFQINVVSGANYDPEDDNIDVEVIFEDGRKYLGTFFTRKNITTLMNRYRETGECANGKYVWASDMIIVDTLSPESIFSVIKSLVQDGELESALSLAAH